MVGEQQFFCLTKYRNRSLIDNDVNKKPTRRGFTSLVGNES